MNAHYETVFDALEKVDHDKKDNHKNKDQVQEIQRKLTNKYTKKIQMMCHSSQSRRCKGPNDLVRIFTGERPNTAQTGSD